MRVYKPDIVIKNSSGQYLALIEIKNGQKIVFDHSNLAFYLEQLLSYASLAIPYIFLISQEKAYMWKYPRTADTPPNFEFSMSNVLKRYNPKQTGWMYESELALTLLDWLFDLSHLEKPSTEEPESFAEMAEFVKELKDSFIQREASLLI